MAIEDDITFYERVPTLGLLDRAALRILAIGTESRYIHTGDVLFSAGEEADGAYVIQEGSFRLWAPAAEGRAETRVGPYTLLGEMALVIETRRPATATALEPSTVLHLPRALFLKMLEGFPDAARKLRDSMAARTDRWTRDAQSVRAALDAHEPNAHENDALEPK